MDRAVSERSGIQIQNSLNKTRVLSGRGLGWGRIQDGVSCPGLERSLTCTGLQTLRDPMSPPFRAPQPQPGTSLIAPDAEMRHAPLEQRELAAAPAQSAAAPRQLWSGEWPGLPTSGKEEASHTMVTIATRAASPMHAWEPQNSIPGKRLPFPQARGSLSMWGPATQAFQVPYCPTPVWIWRFRVVLAQEGKYLNP